MVEFGAGGQIVQNEDPVEIPAVTSPTEGAESAASPPVSAAPGTAAETQPLAPLAAVPVRPRKRRAKGWFCPVCRQPYTALLRITTAPPTGADAKRVSTASSSMGAVTMPEPAVAPLQSAARPGFLRLGRQDVTV